MDDYKPHNSILIAKESTQQLISSKTAQMWKKIYYGIHLGTCVDLCRVYFALLKCKLGLVFLALESPSLITRMNTANGASGGSSSDVDHVL